MRLTHSFIQSVLADFSSVGAIFPEGARFSVNSQTINPGEIFVALSGNRVDGHDFVQDAIAKKAGGILISQAKQNLISNIKPEIKAKIFIGIVSNPYEALINLATAWRMQFSCPVIGITGSIGKTSTKEIISTILTLHDMPHVASEGNQNTALGIALNILRMNSEHKAAVFEMGISKRGEMARMAQIVKPTTAVITTIGHSHMEGLGSINDIAAEKRDIFSAFKPDNIGIVNGDLPILANIAYNHPIIKFGCKTTNQIQARKIQTHGFNTSFVLKLYKDRYNVTLSSNHAGRVTNALAAAAAAHLIGIPNNTIIEGLKKQIAVSSRFEQVPLSTMPATIIDDAYNASPESMRAALLAFEKIESKGQKIAVLGDMLELGVNTPFWHRQLGRFLRKVPSLTHLLLVGEHVKWTKKTAPLGLSVEHVANWEEALTKLQEKMVQKDTLVLVKGSRATQLHELVKVIKQPVANK